MTLLARQVILCRTESVVSWEANEPDPAVTKVIGPFWVAGIRGYLDSFFDKIAP